MMEKTNGEAGEEGADGDVHERGEVAGEGAGEVVMSSSS